MMVMVVAVVLLLQQKVVQEEEGGTSSFVFLVEVWKITGTCFVRFVPKPSVSGGVTSQIFLGKITGTSFCSKPSSKPSDRGGVANLN